MVDATNISGHPEPAWKDRADTVVMCDLTDAGMPGRWEQLWAKRLSDGQFVLCCIPFFTSAIALGDTFATISSNGFERVISEVVERSGNCVIHVKFREEETDAERLERLEFLFEEVARLKIDQETLQPDYVAVSCPFDTAEYTELMDILNALRTLEFAHFTTSEDLIHVGTGAVNRAWKDTSLIPDPRGTLRPGHLDRPGPRLETRALPRAVQDAAAGPPDCRRTS
ncbi:DUF4265 domain-containing protein [Streptomyces sp. NBC_00838]|uniref:DUF4265 domain-containing protein n=1 Tax=Streptomyces sp. NBC_00838 TaxID=2903680 RepID=UPI00387030DD|nr:DUF4265 domain-containing protein [Streptomyces sp. NBC_00838]